MAHRGVPPSPKFQTWDEHQRFLMGFMVTPPSRERLMECIGYFSHGCNKMPNKSKLRKEGSLGSQFWEHSPPWWGRHGARSVRQLGTLHLLSGSRKMSAGSQLALSFISGRFQLTQGGSCRPGYTFLKIHLHIYLRVDFYNGSKSSQINSQD